MNEYIWVLVKDGVPVKWQEIKYAHQVLTAAVSCADGTWYIVRKGEKSVHDPETCTEKPKDECISKEDHEACLKYISYKLDYINKCFYYPDCDQDYEKGHHKLGRLTSEVEALIKKEVVPE